VQIPDITGGIPAIDHHSHASVSRFRTVDQIEKHFATAHMEANVPAEVYDAFIAARNKGDDVTLARLEAEHGTNTLLEQGLLYRSTTFFATALREGCRRLYGAENNWGTQMQIAQEWGGRHPSYSYDKAADLANTPIILTDVPYLDRQVWNPQRYRQVIRVDAYLYPFHPAETTLRGTEFQRFHGTFGNVLRAELKHYGMDAPPASFDAYLQFVDASIERRVQEGAVALKLASAYVRPINFDPAAQDDARAAYEAFATGRPGDRSALENFLARRAAQYACDHGLPMQVHVGMGHPEPGMLIANSAPLLLESFLNTRSLNRLKITLLHGGYPFSSDCAALVQTYGNVFLDFSWMPYLHHFYLHQKLSEWMEILPANKLLFGTDTAAPEFHVAAAHYARDSLNVVLDQGYQRGVWSRRQTEWLAQRVLWENTAELYGLDLKTGQP
jgi:predicted TIM-barrel fold metal-dependent hydrolase